jgi:hypothetical protein
MKVRELRNKVIREIDRREDAIYDSGMLDNLTPEQRDAYISSAEMEITELHRLASIFPDDMDEVFDMGEITYFFATAKASGLFAPGNLWDPQYWGLPYPSGWEKVRPAKPSIIV